MVILSFFFIFLGLVYRNLQLSKVLFYDWDEGMYAQIATEILKNKSLFTTFNGEIWLDKPPLVHTLIAAVFATIGRSEFWARMIMVGIAFLLLVLTYLTAKKIFGGRAALLPTLFLAATPIFIERSALINSDTLIAVSWIGYLLYREVFWAKLIFLTIGVWTKSVMGFYPILLDIFVWFFSKRKIDIKKILLLLGIPSLWYIAGFIKFGNAFIYHHFLSQVLKRITVPIELHFGDKFYYVSFLWQQLGFILIVLMIGYLLYALDLFSAVLKRGMKFFNKNALSVFILMIAPFPFFVFLTFMKTKIYWYVIMFFPFVCISLLYFYVSLKQVLFKRIFAAGVFVYFLINFIPQTFLAKIRYSPPAKLKLGQCIASKPYDTVAFLVDEDERKIKNVLEAAHYNTTSSFYYGGSPSFVFYAKKKIRYFYSVDEFIRDNKKYSLLVGSINDMENNADLKLVFTKPTNTIICSFGSWVAVVQ